MNPVEELHFTYTLENLVDDHTLQQVMWALARVCADKADHLTATWQDHTAAKEWEKRMSLIEVLAVKL